VGEITRPNGNGRAASWLKSDWTKVLALLGGAGLAMLQLGRWWGGNETKLTALESLSGRLGALEQKMVVVEKNNALQGLKVDLLWAHEHMNDAPQSNQSDKQP